jgi:tRNA U34 2-thiouridine synthase MnmA/TrmU
MKAVALVSGGLDSVLAVKLVLDQGIDIEGVHIITPFLDKPTLQSKVSKLMKQLHIPLKSIFVDKKYFRIIRRPKYGYGKGLNPCIDCHIFMLKQARNYAKTIGAKFIITGEVLGQRPKSQHMNALRIIEKEAGLKNKLLRPLSAKLLPETEAEKKGWVDRNKLYAIHGRNRSTQLNLAKKFKITDYSTPAGGCPLTTKEFSNKLRDLLEHKKRVTTKDISLLKIGRHFRFGINKVIVGKNESENNLLYKMKYKTDYLFEVPNHGSPITILQGKKRREALHFASKLTARYSDAETEQVHVRYGHKHPSKSIFITVPKHSKIEKYRI